MEEMEVEVEVVARFGRGRWSHGERRSRRSFDHYRWGTDNVQEVKRAHPKIPNAATLETPMS
jgi:hypothetical protein